MKYNFSTRRRIILTQILYATDIQHTRQPDDDFILSVAQMSKYLQKNSEAHDVSDIVVLKDILQHLDVIDGNITSFLQRSNNIDRLPTVVLEILRVGTYEITFGERKHNIGNVIRDYLSIAQRFSHDDEVGFINGILDHIWKNT